MMSYDWRVHVGMFETQCRSNASVACLAWHDSLLCSMLHSNTSNEYECLLADKSDM